MLKADQLLPTTHKIQATSGKLKSLYSQRCPCSPHRWPAAGGLHELQIIPYPAAYCVGHVCQGVSTG